MAGLNIGGFAQNLRIKATILLFGALLATGIAATVAISAIAINSVRIGGATYTDIINNKDVIADVLPPPLYVIEAYLEANLAFSKAKPVADVRSRIEELLGQYNERRAYWKASNLDPAIKGKLTEKSHVHALRFWVAIELLLPAIERKDEAAAREAYSALTEAYQAHRVVINEIVAETEAMSKAIEATAAQQGRQALWSVGLVDLLAVVLLVGGLIMILRRVVKPIVRLTSVMKDMSAGSGSYDLDVPLTDRKDEIGEMAGALMVFRDAARERRRLRDQADAERKLADEERECNQNANEAAAKRVQAVVDTLGQALDRLAKGDLATQVADECPAEYRKLQHNFNEALDQLRGTIGAIVASAHEVANAASEISASTTDLSQRTEEQAASLEQTSAAMEEMAVTVKNNAENALQANEFTRSARTVADRGGQVVAQAVSAMRQIEESSSRIADIIGMIDEIARQTNLLALNAAVEAARAGEAGRGFAVVASEVRSLAQRSSQAAKDIKELIVSSSEQVRGGVELVNRTGVTLDEIVGSIKQVADVVSGIAIASREQATGLDEINKALNQMDEVTQQNSALVEENAATAKTLDHQAMAMTELGS